MHGQNGSIAKGKEFSYLKDSPLNNWIGELDSDGGTMFFKCDKDKGRGISFEGEDDSYRAIHSSVLFCALRDEKLRNSLMKVYIDYLLKNTPIIWQPLIQSEGLIYPFSIPPQIRNGSISFTLAIPAQVTMTLYTLAGRSMHSQHIKWLSTGAHHYPLQQLLGNGVYVLHLTCGSYRLDNLFTLTEEP